MSLVMVDADIVIVGGSAEARALAARLAGRTVVVLPLAERTAQHWPVPVVEPEALDRARLRLVVDASHPNDVHSSRVAAGLAQRSRSGVRDAVALLRLERAPWRAGRRDRWVRLRREGDAARHVVPGDRVLLVTGRETLKRFACLRGVCVYARQITPHDDVFPLPAGRFLKGDAPFSVVGEMATMRRLRIDWLILRNAGGSGGWPKLEAARRLGVRVGMLDRPVLPRAPVVRSVEEAMRRIAAWL